MTMCNTCGQYYTEGHRHSCPSAWEIWDFNDETREDAVTAYGDDADEAATNWAESEDSGGDYTIVAGSPVVVCVSRVGSTEVQTIIVSGESVPEYHASEAKPENVAAVKEWNEKHPVGTPVRWTYQTFEKLQTVKRAVEGKTSTVAKFNAETGPEVRVDKSPYVVKLKDVQVIEVSQGAEETTPTT
jgi:hypothetical protein